jgi:cell division ATPase FtsA
MFKLPFFKKDTHKPPKYLSLELNAESVRCLAFYKEDGTIKIIGSGVEYLEEGVIRNGVIVDFDEASVAAEQAIREATMDSEDEVKNVIIGVTSDLCLESVTTAKINRSSAQKPISDNEIEAFQEKIVQSAHMQVQSNYANYTGDPEIDFQLITTSVIYSKIGEEKTEVLEGKTGNSLEMAIYTAFCPVYHVQNLQKLAKKLKLKILAISSENFALLKALKHSELEDSDLVLAQIGADFTNVGVVFGGSIVTNQSLHLGKKHFVDEISRIMGLTYNEARKVLESHALGQLSQSESVVVQNCLSEVVDVWQEGLEMLFSQFSGVKTFAPYIYLFGEGTQLPEIEEALTKNPWMKSIPFKSPPSIQELSLTDFDKIVDATGKVNNNDWLAPAVLAYIYEEVAL